MKPTSTTVFLHVAKNVEVIRWKIWAVQMMLKCFPAKFQAYNSPDWQYGDGRYHAKGWFLPTAFQGVLARHSTLSETNEPSLLFFACLHFQCWTNTLYTTLTSRAINKQLCEPARFQYALSPTLQMAVSIRMVVSLKTLTCRQFFEVKRALRSTVIRLTWIPS